MASNSTRYTLEQIHQYLDDEFDIPEDGVLSDIEGLEDDDPDAEENDLVLDSGNFIRFCATP